MSGQSSKLKPRKTKHRAKSNATENLVRYASLDDMPPSPPLSAAFKALSDEDIARAVAEDPDSEPLPDDFWDNAMIMDPQTRSQITLRLPRDVLAYFKATGKGYQSRISAVLASYVASQKSR